MRYIILAAAIMFASFGQGHAEQLSCYRKAAGFKAVSHERPSTITLDARRVKAIDGNVLTYDLGKETIVIEADSFASRRFLADVGKGRCAAREKVTLQPQRKSPFNTRFKAVRPH